MEKTLMSISIFKNSRSQILNIVLATTLPFVAPVLEAEEQVLQEILPSSQQELQEKPVSPPSQLQKKPIKPKKSTSKKSVVKKKPKAKTPINPPAPTYEPESVDSAEDIIRRIQGTQTSSPSSVSDSPQYMNLNDSATDSQMADLLSDLGMATSPDIVSGSDPNSAKQAISRLEATYGLSPEILNLQNQLPSDPESVIRQLNLSPPTTNKIDLSDHTPTVEEIIRALQSH